MAAVIQNVFALKYASERIKSNKEMVLATVNQDGSALRYAPEIFKNNKDVVLAAVNKYGEALQYAPEEFKNKKDIVLAAVIQNGSTLKYASAQLQNDLDLLNLLYSFFILPENKIEDKELFYQKWFFERMKVRDVLIEQKLMQKSIPIHHQPVKSRKLKF